MLNIWVNIIRHRSLGEVSSRSECGANIMGAVELSDGI